MIVARPLGVRRERGAKNSKFTSRIPIVGIVVLLLATGFSLEGQQITGRILGGVLDSSGAAVPNAQIKITNQNTGVVRNTVSGSDGLYNVPEVAAGTYSVAITAAGFSPQQVKDVVVTVGSDTRVDLKLQVGAVTQSVTVSEAAPLVETTSSSIGSTVDEQKVADLPLNGRNWTDLSLLQPGVIQARVMTGNTPAVAGYNGTIFSSNGAPITSNAVTLDGASEKNLIGLNNSSMNNTSLGVDAIQEYKVVTSLFSAEYGMSMGSQTTVVSKGGTNQWHGDAYDYLRNASLDARNYFDVLDTNNVYKFGTDKSLVYPGKRIPPFRRNDFGASFGGPIRKDKTFFYAVYEGIQQEQAQTITRKTFPMACFVDQNNVLQATIPAQVNDNAATNPYGLCTSVPAPPNTPAGYNTTTGVFTLSPVVVPLAKLFPQPNVVGYPTFNYSFPYLQPASEDFGQIRVDQNISSSDSAFFRWTQDDSHQVGVYNYRAYLVNPNSSSLFATLGENHIFSPRLLNAGRLSVSRTFVSIFPSVDASAPNAPPAGLILTPNPNEGSLLGGVSPGGGITGPGADSSDNKALVQTMYTYDDDVFWTKGQHAFKFGALVNYIYDSLTNSQFGSGSLSFSAVSNFFAADYSAINLQPIGQLVPTDFRYLTAGFYGQDDYRVNSRLTLNLGLRYEFATVPLQPNPALAYSIRDGLTDSAGVAGRLFANPTLHNFSPRLGFAWDVTGKGKTSIRGGAGIYYDTGGYYGGLMHNTVDETPPAYSTISLTNTLSIPAIPLTLPFPALFNSQAPSVRGIDYNLPQPTLLQHSLEIDQQLPWSIGLSIGYNGSRGWHLIQEQEENQVVPLSADSRGVPIYGCWAAPVITAANALANPVTGECPSNLESFGPRRNTALGGAEMTKNRGDSYYNSLQLQLIKRITQGLQFQVAYTLSKVIDDGQQQDPTFGTENTQDPYNDFVDRGPAVFDTPQNLRANMIYHAPTVASQGAMGKLANGWWFSSIVSAQSGYPFSPTVSIDRALENLLGGYGNIERPSLAPSFNAHKDIEGKITQWFNPTEFALQPAGQYGNAGRDILRGPGFTNVDFSIVKDTKVGFLGEAGNVEFRAEFFNLLNHPNFGLPSGAIFAGNGAPAGSYPVGQFQPVGSTSPLAAFSTVGQITGTVANSRQVQYALKILF